MQLGLSLMILLSLSSNYKWQGECHIELYNWRKFALPTQI